jgi:hypothetical protein
VITDNRHGKREGTPEARLRRFCILRARASGHSPQWVRERATELFHIPAVEGFCLSALSKPQLIELADHVVNMTGGTPGRHRRGDAGTRRRGDRAGIVVRLASREQRDLIAALARQVFGGPFGPGSAFGSFLVGMTGKSETRLLTMDQARKVVEALRAMEKRGWKPRGGGGGSDGSDGSDRSDRRGGTGR